LSSTVIGYHLVRNWEKYGLVGLGAGLGFKPTRAATWTAIRWSTTNVARPILIGLTTAAVNVARVVLLPIATGYVIGAVAGTLVSEQFWGESGREHAIQLYTGRVSWDEYWSTVGDGFDILFEDLM